jgi:hypothetical protein
MIVKRRFRRLNKEITTMKKLMTLMVGLSFALGTVALSFADDAKTDDASKMAKKKKSSKKKAPKKDDAAPKK